MKYLVTGGCGYIGACIAAALLNDRHSVDILDWMSNGSNETNYTMTRLGARIFTMDFNDVQIQDIFEENRYDAVIHCAAFIEVEQSISEAPDYYYNNAVKTAAFADICSEYGVKHFIFSSTAAVYDPQPDLLNEADICRPQNPYGLSKYMAEQALELNSRSEPRNGMKTICFRYFNVAGADVDNFIGEDRKHETHLIPLALKAKRAGRNVWIFGKDYPTSDGTCIRDFVDVRDIVDAHMLALKYNKKNFDIFNLGSGRGYTVFDVVKACKTDFKFSERRSGDPAFLVADISKAKKVLKWEPRRTLLDMVNSAEEFMELKDGC